MGTKYSGSYIGTKGASAPPKTQSAESPAATLPQDRLRHANEGDFNVNGRPTSGGHGQDNIEKLNGTKYEPKITKTYSNGVRAGSIPHHKNPADREPEGHAWFPKNWTNKTIRAAANYVARLKRAQGVEDGESIFGTYKGVAIGIKKRNGRIVTVFPSFNQPTTTSKKGKKK